MWILFGNKERTERVPNGKSVERHCSACNETAVFYERTASTKFSLYFIELVEYGKRRVMACGACGALYATDELGSPDERTGVDKVMGTVEEAGAKFSSAAKGAFGKLSEAAKSGLDDLGFNRGSAPADPPRRSSTDFDDPLTSDEEALEAKFRDLEKKYRIGQ